MKNLIRNLFILILNALYNNAFKLTILTLLTIIWVFSYLFYNKVLMLEFLDAFGTASCTLVLFVIIIIVIILSDITVPIIKFIETSLKGIKIDKSWKNK